MEIVDRPCRKTRGLEDRTLVCPEHIEPAREIGGMVLARRECNAQIRAQEGRAKLGNQLFTGVSLIGEAPAELAMAPGGMTGPMGQLVQEGGVPAMSVAEGSACRHADHIPGRRIKGTPTPGLNASTRRRDEGFGGSDPLRFGARRKRGRQSVRQSVALLDIEHRIALQERDPGLCFLARLRIDIGTGEGRAVDNRGPTLTPTDAFCPMPIKNPACRKVIQVGA